MKIYSYNEAGRLNTQSGLNNHWNNINKDITKISLWMCQTVTNLNKRSLSIISLKTFTKGYACFPSHSFILVGESFFFRVILNNISWKFQKILYNVGFINVKNYVFKAISGKVFHPLISVNNGVIQNGSVYLKGLLYRK